MTYQHVTVKKSERGVLLRNGDFERILRPGDHRLFSLTDKLELRVFGIGQAAFTDPLADYLMAREPEVVVTEFVRVELTETPHSSCTIAETLRVETPCTYISAMARLRDCSLRRPFSKALG